MEMQNQARYYLYSFAPSTGIGFYSDGNQLFQFDLVTEDDIPLTESKAAAARHFEFDQVEAGLSFEELDKLKELTRNEYLRDKKNTYYAFLFTSKLNKDLRLQTLEILNDPELSNIELSPKAVSAIKKTAKPKLVSLILKEAFSLDLKHVEECLTYGELGAIAASLRRDTSFSKRAHRSKNLWSRLISFLRQFFETTVSVAFNIVRAWARFIESTLAPRVYRRQTPALKPTWDYAFDLSPSNFKQIRSSLSEISVRPIYEVENLGKSISAAIERWELEPSYGFRRRAPYIKLFWRLRLDIELLETIRSRTRSLSNKSVYNRSASNILFSLDFLPWRMTKEEDIGRNLEQCAFFISFYSNPRLTSKKLKWKPYSLFRLEDWFLFLQTPQYVSEEKLGRAELIAICQELYCTINILSLMLITRKELPPFWPDFKYALIHQLKLRHESKIFTKLGIPDPFVILFSNVLSWAVQTGQEEFFRDLSALLHEADIRERDLRPYIRFIL